MANMHGSACEAGVNAALWWSSFHRGLLHCPQMVSRKLRTNLALTTEVSKLMHSVHTRITLPLYLYLSVYQSQAGKSITLMALQPCFEPSNIICTDPSQVRMKKKVVANASRDSKIVPSVVFQVETVRHKHPRNCFTRVGWTLRLAFLCSWRPFSLKPRTRLR